MFDEDLTFQHDVYAIVTRIKVEFFQGITFSNNQKQRSVFGKLS